MQADDADPRQLAASFFDGRSARAQPVMLTLHDNELLILGDGLSRRVALHDVQWPERTRHGMRVAHFKTGGSVQNADAAAWDEWVRRSGRGESLVVRAQQSWRWVALSAALLVALIITLQQWGLPMAARAVVAVAPLSLDESLGEGSLALIDGQLMRPSRLPEAEQKRVRAAFERAVGALPPDTVPPWKLLFRRSRIGANAFALPGGTMVMTDEMVTLVGGDEEVLTAVLAHELGHVRQRHGLRLLVQATALGGLASLIVGDFSSVLATAPVLLGQASYSRDAEREADAEAVRILRAASISPLVMVKLFERLDAARADKKQGSAGEKKNIDKETQDDSVLGIAIASHPADAERIRFFTEAARGN